MSNRKYRHFFMYLNLCTFISLKWKGYPGMTNARCQHWDFNSVIENYISGMKLVCTVAYCLMTVINQPSSFQSRFLYSKLSYCLLQCGPAWGYSCCFHFSELVTRQSFNCATDFCIFKSTALCETVLHYTKQTTINKQILSRFQKKFFQRPKNDTHLLFFDVLLFVGHFFDLENSRVRSFHLPRTQKRSSDGIFSSHPWFLIV